MEITKLCEELNKLMVENKVEDYRMYSGAGMNYYGNKFSVAYNKEVKGVGRNEESVTIYDECILLEDSLELTPEEAQELLNEKRVELATRQITWGTSCRHLLTIIPKEEKEFDSFTYICNRD